MENYEQKYEQALDNFKKIKAANKDNKELVDFIEYEYPELKESEDERIRKWLIDDVKDTISSGHMPKEYEYMAKNAISWLEKQGEQKPTNEIKPKFKVGDTIRLKGSSAEYTIESIYGGCYHGKGWGLSIDCCEDYELVEQKPAWSEEDEKGLGDTLWAIQQARTIAKDENDMGNLWYAENWLKSLKERYTWKPSEKQMNQLGWVAEQNKDNIIGKELMSFYQDLKKLREE